MRSDSTQGRIRRSRRPLAALVAAAVGVLALAIGAGTATAVTLKSGTITLTTGSNSAPFTGSWVRLYQTALGAGNPAGYFVNPSSPAADQTYTPVVNGTQGIKLGTPVQGLASPAFDGGGNSLTNTILKPVPFAGVNFSAFTAVNTDKKTKNGKKGLWIKVAGGKSATVAVTSADFSGWTIAYGGDSKYSTPGATSDVLAGGNLTGSLTWKDPKNKALGGSIILNWSSQITEPPFQPFTAVWQLQGTYTP